MAVLFVGAGQQYTDLPQALAAAASSDTIIILTARPGGGDYSGVVTTNGNVFQAYPEAGHVDLELAEGVSSFTASSGSSTSATFTIFGNSGNNTITGSVADDLIEGAAGNDMLYGGGGTDIVSYILSPAGVTVNLATGSASDGHGGTDTLNSFEAIAGSLFADTLTGDSGSNMFLGLYGNDIINGGGGIDTVSYEPVGLGGGGVSVNLATGTASDGYGGTDTLISIERVIGTSFADTLVGDSGDNSFLPGIGADTVDGGAGFDFVSYESSTSRVLVDLAAQRASSDGLGGSDTLRNIEGVIGSSFNDILAGSTADELFIGGSGNDIIRALGGSDVAAYAFSQSDYVITYNAFSQTYTVTATIGPEGTDTLTGVEFLAFDGGGTVVAIEDTVPDPADETLVGDAGDNTFTPEDGDDTVDGAGGTDTVDYSSSPAAITVNLATGAVSDGYGGTDSLTSIERVIGSAHGDSLTGSSADEFFVGGGGNDTINGAGGTDRVTYDLAQSNYIITFNVGAGTYTVEARNGAEGTDTLSGIEFLAFNGGSSIVAIEDTVSNAAGESLVGDAEDNTFYPGAGDDTVDGLGGTDTVDYSDSPSAITVNLATGAVSDGHGDTDTLTSIERVIGSTLGDSLTGGANDDIFIGGGGDDTIDGAGGFDTISYVTSTSGILADLAAGTVADGLGGEDSVSNIEAIEGSAHDDDITGGDDFIHIRPGFGNDTITGGSGGARLSYADRATGVTVLVANGTAGSASTAAVEDTFSNITEFEGSQANDIFLDADGDHSFFGNGGTDRVSFKYNATAITVRVNDSGVSAEGQDGSLNTLVDIEHINGTDFDDTLLINDFATGITLVHGEIGWDTVSFAGASGGVQASVGGYASLLSGEGDQIAINDFEDLIGTSYDDDLMGSNHGAGYLSGGEGNDTLSSNLASSSSTVASYRFDPTGVTVNLATGQATDGYGDTDTLIRIYHAEGSEFGDTLIGTSAGGLLRGRGGDDNIDGSGGIDRAIYALAADQYSVVYNEGDDTFTVTALSGDEGVDTLRNIEILAFEDGAAQVSIWVAAGLPIPNVLTGDDGDNTFSPGAGDQTIDGRGGIDTVSYADAPGGVDVNLTTGFASDGQGGTDTLTSIERIVASAFGDTIVGSAADETFLGGYSTTAGDTFNGLGGVDTLSFEDSDIGVWVNWQDNQVTYYDFDNPGIKATYDTYVSIENFVGSDYGDRFFDVDGANAYDGGANDQDSLSFSDLSSGVTIDLRNGRAIESDGTVNTFVNIESISGTGGDDRIIWAPGYASISGGSGGNDTMSFANHEYAVTLDLRWANSGSDADGNAISLGNIAFVEGTAYDDTLSGTKDYKTDAFTMFMGLGGNDHLTGDTTNSDATAWVSYRLDPSAVTVNLAAGTASDGFGGTDTLASFEGVEGSLFGDTLTGDDTDTLFRGLAGNDTIDGAGGTDTAIYALAADQYVVIHDTGAGTYDVIALSGDEGRDTLTGIETLSFDGGTSDVAIADAAAASALVFSTALNGDSGDNQFAPTTGNNLINGFGGTDTISYAGSPGGAYFNLAIGLGRDIGRGRTDILTGIENAIGTALSDTFVSGEGDNTFAGGDSTDMAIYALSQDEYFVRYDLAADGFKVTALSGNEGTDTLLDIEVLSFENGTSNFYLTSKKLTGDASDNSFTPAPGILFIDGQGGTDTVNLSGYVSGTGATIDLTSGIVTTDSPLSGHPDRTLALRGVENVDGSAEDDTFIIRDGNLPFGLVNIIGSYNGLGGNDTIDYSQSAYAAAVNLPAQLGVTAGPVHGLLGIEYVVGSDFGDVFVGTDADNRFTGGDGDDLIFAGNGTDTAVFSNSADQYTVAFDAGTGVYTVTAISGGEGTDTLHDVEFLAFDGGTSQVAIEDAVPSFAGLDTDLDGDGDDDIVFALDSNGATVLNGADGSAGLYIGYPGRTVIGIGDFNGDGDSDLLFRYPDGNHSGYDVGGGGPWIGRGDRTAVAIGDFNGDGDDDVLFQFANNEKHIVDFDSGNTWLGYDERSIEAVGDFDGDGDDDILFELDAGGYVTNNADGTGGLWLGGPNRSVTGIGDFDGDGDDDILFVLDSGGLMINDGEGGGMQWFGFIGRAVAGIGDFDGNGSEDILFQLADGNHTIVSPAGGSRWVARTNATVRDIGDFDGDGDDDILFEMPGGGFVVDPVDGGPGQGLYFFDRALVAGDPLGLGLTSDADLV